MRTRTSNRSVKFILTATAIAGAILAGCKKGTAPAATPATPTPPAASSVPATPGKPAKASYTPGKQTEVLRRKIGPAGGTMEIAGSGSPIDGIAIKIPAGAISAQQEFIAGYNSGTLVLRAGRPAGITLSLHAAGKNGITFAKPAAIIVPVPRGSAPPVPYFIDNGGRLHPMAPGRFDSGKGLATFYTRHASSFTWVYPDDPPEVDKFDTDFSPGANGFSIENPGSAYCSGQCAGMSAFSIWYYMNHGGSGHLATKFLRQVPGRNTSVETLVASRAQLSFDTAEFTRLLAEQDELTDQQKFNAICNAIYNTGMPVLLGLHDTAVKEDHAIVAYGYDTLKRTIKVYDPNYPMRTMFVTLGLAQPLFQPYDGYRHIFLGGDHDYPLREPFEHILADAQADFHGTDTADITALRPGYGGRFDSPRIPVSGKVYSGPILARRIKITAVGANGRRITTPRDVVSPNDGKFFVETELNPGVNTLEFHLFGTDCAGADREITFEQPKFIVDTEPYPYTLVLGEEPQPQPQCDLKRIHVSGAGWAELQVSKASGAPCWVGLLFCGTSERDGVKTTSCTGPGRRPLTVDELKADCPGVAGPLLAGAAARAAADIPLALPPDDNACYGIHVCSRIILCGD